MHRTAGVIVLISAAITIAAVLGPGRTRSGRMREPVLACAGASVGIGGLLLLEDVGIGSWIAAPVFLAVVTVVQARLLFAPGGPFRT